MRATGNFLIKYIFVIRSYFVKTEEQRASHELQNTIQLSTHT